MDHPVPYRIGSSRVLSLRMVVLAAIYSLGLWSMPSQGQICDSLQEVACVREALKSLTLAAEQRCAPYDRGDYEYSQSVEDSIIASLGAIFSPYTGERFETKYYTDIEHIVAISEAHDSGLCARSRQERKTFAGDILNLTLAEPHLNRYKKRHYDAAKWIPERNKCWFAARVVAVRVKYRLSIDSAERKALDDVLSMCTSLALVR